ncbi:MAG: hypothetical protein EXR59_03880 [Dehalococcoidia bacterium]|nr:hypothetical protein [Dehalococcoidia bacterium]
MGSSEVYEFEEQMCRQIGHYLSAPRQFAMPNDKPHYPPDKQYRLLHLKLEVKVNFDDKSIEGIATHTLTPINDGTTHIEFDAKDLAISSVSEDKRQLKFSTQNDKLKVDIGRSAAAGDEIVVTTKYTAKPYAGLYFVEPDKGYPNKPVQVWSQGEDENNRYWFPNYDFPNERFTSEMIISVPSKFFALSNGSLAGMTEKNGIKTFHWKQEAPHSNYLITLAAGEFEETTDVSEIVPVAYYHPKGRKADALRAMGNTPDMLKFFSQNIGVKYPWAKYAQICVADFIFGGMENTSATTLTDTILHDEKAHLDYSSDPLVAHELAHQWFGDLLTCHEWAHAWLNEGFATYFQALYEEHHLGVDEFRYDMLQKSEAYFREDRERYRRPIVERTYHDPIDLFDRHLYEKGSLVLHMLRRTLGDKLFWRAMNNYVARNAGRNVVTSDLQRAAEEVSGRSLESFFEQWVFKTGFPEFKVRYSWDDKSNTVHLSVAQTQNTDDKTPVFNMSIDVLFVTTAGKQSFTVEIKEKEHNFYFNLKENPLMVSFDPGNWVLKTLDFERPKEMLFFTLKNDEDCTGRIAAARAIGKLGGAEAVSELTAALMNDPFWGVQSAAARALGEIRSDEALNTLIDGLKLKHPKARRAVVSALGEFKQDVVSRALRPLLENEESYFVQAEAAKSIGKNRSPEALKILQSALSKDSFNDVLRSSIFDGMSELRDENALLVLKEWSTYGKPMRARESALSNMGRVAEYKQDKRDVLDVLTDTLEESFLRTKLSALDSLRVLKDEAAIPAIERLANREKDGRVVRRAREVMQQIRQVRDRGEDVKRLREELERQSDESRKLKERMESIENKLNSK